MYNALYLLVKDGVVLGSMGLYGDKSKSKFYILLVLMILTYFLD